MSESVVVKFSYNGKLQFEELSLQQKQKILIFSTHARQLVMGKKIKLVQNIRKPFEYRYERKWAIIEFAMEEDNIPILTNIIIAN